MKKKFRGSGFTIIEIVVAAVILAIVVVAAAGYRYHSTMDVRKAEIQTTATKIALMLLEGWRGEMGLSTYDPVAYFATSGMTVTKITSGGITKPNEFDTELGRYRIDTDGVVYYATLSSKAVIPNVRPQALNVVIGWRLDRGPGNLASTDKVIRMTSFVTNTD